MADGQSIDTLVRQDLYLKISRSLTEDEARSLRTYLGGSRQLPDGTIQHDSAHEMFNKLERAGNSLSFLAGLLEKIGRQDYAKEVNAIAQREEKALEDGNTKEEKESKKSTTSGMETKSTTYRGKQRTKGGTHRKKPYGRSDTTKPDSMMLVLTAGMPDQNGNEIKIEVPPGLHLALDDETKKQLLKKHMKETDLKQCRDWGEDRLKLLNSMKNMVSTSFLREKTEQVIETMFNWDAKILRAYEGCVIFHIHFDNEKGLENFWASHKTGKLSKQFTDLAITNEMRDLVDDRTLCVSTVALQEDYLSWKHYFNGTTPGIRNDNKVTIVKGCTLTPNVEGTTTGQTTGTSEDPMKDSGAEGVEARCHSAHEDAAEETHERSPAKATGTSYQADSCMYAEAVKSSPEDESPSSEGQQWKKNVKQLLDACGKGNLQSVKHVIESGHLRVSVEDETGTTPLHLAAANRHVNIARYLLHKGANVDERNHMDETALHLAAGSGDVRMVKLLLEHNADISATDCLGNTALHFAAREGKTNALHLLLWLGANIDATGNDNLTALHLAAWNGHANVVNDLLVYGADLNKKDIWGHTALHIAAREGYPLIVKDLLHSKADLYAQADDNYSALHFAASDNQLEVVEVLLSSGAAINDTDKYGDTALHSATSYGHVTMMKTLVEKGAEVNATNSYGKTPLYAAAFGGHDEALEYLIDIGADPHAKDKQGDTALHWAAYHGHVKVVELLLSKGLDSNAKGCNGRTAVHRAAERGQAQTLQVLLQAGGSPNMTNEDGETPLHIALLRNPDVTQLLLEKGGDPSIKSEDGGTGLHLAAWTGNVDALRLVLETGKVDVDEKDFAGCTALHLASEQGHFEVVEVLIDIGADPHTRDKQGDTALHWAAYHGHVKVVELLLSKGLDSNAKGCNGITAVHRAAERGQAQTLQVLLAAGGSPNVTSEDGETPLHIALLRNPDVTQLLLEKGGNPSIKSKDGRTGLHLAVWSGSVDALRLVLETGKVDVDEKDSAGCTALHLASEQGHWDSVKMLLDHGASASAKDNNNLSPLDKARLKGHEKVLALLEGKVV
ncbi:uncharacterized protein LOC144875153 [Branchiostoma floridae x Branchiostoma japonicum]